MDNQEVQKQVKRITENVEFSSSVRLRDFLNYIVEEALAGRSEKIKGLTIAQNVFSVGSNFDPESNSIVRVEAGRLRRRLAHYYSTTGQADPVIISVPKGSYAPLFTDNLASAQTNIRDSSKRWFGWSTNFRWAMVVVLIFIGLLTWYIPTTMRPANDNPDSVPVSSMQEPGSDMEILFRQTLVLMMPPENKARLDTSKALFQNMIDTDSTYVGGYVGKSLANSIGVLFFKSVNPEYDLSQAMTYARQAIELQPGNGLGYAALALALSLDSQHEQALKNARLSIAVPQRDALADGMVALVLLNADMPESAIDQLMEAIRLHLDGPRTPHLNILGIAKYVTGDYEGALQSFQKNLDRAGPTGPHMDIFVAATYARLGNDFQAQAIFDRMRSAYPDYPVKQWLSHYIKSEGELQETLNILQSIGNSKGDISQ